MSSGQYLVRLGDIEIALQNVRKEIGGLCCRMLPRAIATCGANLVDAHETRHAMLAARLSGLTEIEEDARRAVDAVAGDERCPDQPEESCVLLSSRRDRLTQLGVVPTRSDFQEPAKRSDVVLLPAVCFDERIDSADPPNAELCRHRPSSRLVAPLDSRVHKILGSLDTDLDWVRSCLRGQ